MKQRVLLVLGAPIVALTMLSPVPPGLLALIFVFDQPLGIPEVELRNDTASSIWVASCAEMGTLDPGERRKVQVYHPCLLFQDGTRIYLGCLDVPDEAILASAVVNMSTATTGLSQSDCIKSDHYGRLSKFRRLF